MRGHRYYLKDREIGLVVTTLSSYALALERLPEVYPKTGWLNMEYELAPSRCRNLIKKLQAKQGPYDRGYAPALKENAG